MALQKNDLALHVRKLNNWYLVFCMASDVIYEPILAIQAVDDQLTDPS